MAIVTSNEYDHIDIVSGSNTNRHMLKDTAARADINDLKSILDAKEITSNVWIQGIHNGATAEWQSSARCTLSNVYILNKNDKITVRNIDSGLYFAVAGCKNGSNVYDSGWQTSDFVYHVPAAADGAAFIVNVKGPDDAISPSDIQTMEVAIKRSKLPYTSAGDLTSSYDLDSIIDVGFYRAFANTLPAHWPATGGGNLIVIRGSSGDDDFGVCQMICLADKILTRFGAGGTSWTDWQTYYSEGNSPAVSTLSGSLSTLNTNAYSVKGRIVGTTNINVLNNQGFYRVSRDSTNTWKPTNWPIDGGGNLLVIKGYIDGTDSFGNCQCVFGANEIRVRFGAGGTSWTDWQIFRMSGTASDIVALNNEEETTLKLRQLSTSRDLSATLTVQPVTLLHFSDLHQNSTALSRIVDFKTHYASLINDAIHTGDTINTTAGANTFANVSGAGSILNVIGNHDTWDGNNNYVALSEADANSRFISPFSSNWGNVTIPSGKCYYYKDYYDSTNKKNVMLIVLDVMHTNQDQLEWFAGALATAKSAGRHVIIANHTIMGKLEDMTYLDSGFDNPMYPRNVTPDYPFPMYIPSAYVDAVDTFVSGGGIVVAWLAGHMHNDTLATYHNILNIAVTTAGDYSGVGRTTDYRVSGTKSQDAFNVLGINTVYGHLYCMRVGLDYNAVMKKIDTFCWDYVNHRMIYTC